MSSSIRKQKGGFRMKAGRRQTLFIRGDNLKECMQKYCQRTGAEIEEFDDSLSGIFGGLQVKPEEPEAPGEPEGEGEGGKGEPGTPEDPEGDPETPEDLAKEIEDSGGEVPTLEAELQVAEEIED